MAEWRCKVSWPYDVYSCKILLHCTCHYVYWRCYLCVVKSGKQQQYNPRLRDSHMYKKATPTMPSLLLVFQLLVLNSYLNHNHEVSSMMLRIDIPLTCLASLINAAVLATSLPLKRLQTVEVVVQHQQLLTLLRLLQQAARYLPIKSLASLTSAKV